MSVAEISIFALPEKYNVGTNVKPFSALLTAVSEPVNVTEPLLLPTGLPVRPVMSPSDSMPNWLLTVTVTGLLGASMLNTVIGLPLLVALLNISEFCGVSSPCSSIDCVLGTPMVGASPVAFCSRMLYIVYPLPEFASSRLPARSLMPLAVVAGVDVLYGSNLAPLFKATVYSLPLSHVPVAGVKRTVWVLLS